MEVDAELIQKVKEMKSLGATASDILKVINTDKDHHSSSLKMVAIKCFLKVLHVPMSRASCIWGWEGFGGELSDEQIDGFVKLEKL